MKFKILLSALILSCCSMNIFADTNNTNSAATSAPQAQNQNGQILETIVMISTNEINAGKLALQKTSNADVKAFAQAMIKEHSANLHATKSLAHKMKITLADSDNSKDLQKAGEDELAKLKDEQGKDFDKDYIDAMVTDHKDGLKLIDDKLVPNATGAKVIAQVKATRAMVARHLEMAKAAQEKIDK